MKFAGQRLFQRLKALSESADLMLVLAGLLQRGFGFLASLVLARQVGLEAVGLYTSLQISSNSPTSPLSAPLANSATLVAAEHQHTTSLRHLLLAHLPALVLTGSLAALGSGALMWWSATQTAAWQQWPLALPLFFVALLSVATLGNQLMAGLFHGVRKSLPLAQVTMACTLVAIALCWPAATFGGIVGSLTLATAAVAAPGLILVGLAWSDPNRTPPTSGPALRKEVLAQWFKSTPTVASTLIRNGVNWFCSIYLVQQYHGPAGVGIVTIGLQWMMLMQLPTLAWGGRMVADMASAQQQSAGDMARVTRLWLVKCAWTTALLGLAVAAASPVLAHLYRLHDSPLPWVLAANALVSLCMAATFVLERTFFCQSRQRAWFALSLAGDAAQLALTFAFAHHSVVVMSLSSLCSALLVFIGGQWLLTRHHPLHASKS